MAAEGSPPGSADHMATPLGEMPRTRLSAVAMYTDPSQATVGVNRIVWGAQ